MEIKIQYTYRKLEENVTINNMDTKIIDPAVLSSVAHLELIARQAVEGSVSGLHHSHYQGRNVEFNEHRPYNPGDELRLVDWRVYAKTDRFHVKLFEEDTNLRALILTDLSGSMQFGESTISKAAYAQQLAAALSYLMLMQGDSVGISVFDNQIRSYIPPRQRSDQWGVLLERLAETPITDEESDIRSVLSEIGEMIKKRGMIILISDLIDDPASVLRSLSLLRKQQQEILLFHVMAPEEIDLPYHGTIEFHALEGQHDPLLTSPKRLKKRYVERVNQFIDEYRNGCLERGIDYTLVKTNRSLERFLREYLQRR